jgi:microcystin-dependent protein
MASFNYPQSIDPNTPAIATEVQTNFDALLAWILANLMQADGTKVMTGPLTLMPGDPASGAFAANKTYVDSKVLVGEIKEFAGDVLPTGYLWCNGGTYSETDQPKLFSVIGRKYTDAGVPTGSFKVPDKGGKVGVGYKAGDALFGTLGVAGGSPNWEKIQHLHSVPEHGHSATATMVSSGGVAHAHGHNIAVSAGGAHDHNFGGGTQHWWVDPVAWGTDSIAPGGGQKMGKATWATHDGHGHGITGGISNSAASATDHVHGITATVANQVAFNTQNDGTATTVVNKNYQPYLVTNFIIYAGEN